MTPGTLALFRLCLLHPPLSLAIVISRTGLNQSGNYYLGVCEPSFVRVAECWRVCTHRVRILHRGGCWKWHGGSAGSAQGRINASLQGPLGRWHRRRASWDTRVPNSRLYVWGEVLTAIPMEIPLIRWSITEMDYCQGWYLKAMNFVGEYDHLEEKEYSLHTSFILFASITMNVNII